MRAREKGGRGGRKGEREREREGVTEGVLRPKMDYAVYIYVHVLYLYSGQVRSEGDVSLLEVRGP